MAGAPDGDDPKYDLYSRLFHGGRSNAARGSTGRLMVAEGRLAKPAAASRRVIWRTDSVRNGEEQVCRQVASRCRSMNSWSKDRQPLRAVLARQFDQVTSSSATGSTQGSPLCISPQDGRFGDQLQAEDAVGLDHPPDASECRRQVALRKAATAGCCVRRHHHLEAAARKGGGGCRHVTRSGAVPAALPAGPPARPMQHLKERIDATTCTPSWASGIIDPPCCTELRTGRAPRAPVIAHQAARRAGPGCRAFSQSWNGA
jgi:hypothetical protein